MGKALSGDVSEAFLEATPRSSGQPEGRSRVVRGNPWHCANHVFTIEEERMHVLHSLEEPSPSHRHLQYIQCIIYINPISGIGQERSLAMGMLLCQ